MNYLISYPRSGNTWLRYCVEYISEMPTIGYLSADASCFDRESIGKFAGINTQETDPILIKRHGFEPSFAVEHDKIIVLVRDYQEVIIRHTRQAGFNAFQSSLQGKENSIDYYSIIQQYDKWSGEKLLIYYEDLMMDLEFVLKRVSDFLLEKDHSPRINDIVGNLDFHKAASIRVYNIHSRSETGGNKLKYHSSRISRDEQIKRQNFIKNKGLDIYDKYLKKYEKNTYLQ
jgi:hypothetical protein